MGLEERLSNDGFVTSKIDELMNGQECSIADADGYLLLCY